MLERQEAIQLELESSITDMDKMADLVDELNDLSMRAVDLDVKLMDKRIDKMMPELGFGREDNDRLVHIDDHTLCLSFLRRICHTGGVLQWRVADANVPGEDSVTGSRSALAG